MSLPCQFATSAGCSKATGFADFFGTDQQAFQDFNAATAEFPACGLLSPLFVGLVTFARNINAARGVAWEVGRFPDLVRTYFFFAIRARQVRRLLEKSPDHIAYLPEMRSTFPHARFLFLHRHPVDTYASHVKRLARARSAERSDQALRWLRVRPARFVKRWQAQVSTALAASQAAGADVMLLRYDELTIEPARCLAEVMAFVGEPFDVQALPDDRPNRWVDDPLVSQSIRPNQTDWESLIGHEAAAFIERATADLCRQLDYSSKTGVF